ncbi:toxic anion resistance protein [Vibrio sp. S4M6]|uniref:toxic anion resistance protein n=1 Tax=Vibrio sinus TaxID=2946865 RepID=UPI00202A2272|nr:toxic anion resistance protein [Vibrio sinus]MCL9783466.1 toxic anion resistance protein [Vibrio sinus]
MVFQPKTFKPKSVQPTASTGFTPVAVNPVASTPAVTDCISVESQVRAAIETYQLEIRESGLEPEVVCKEATAQLQQGDVYSSHGISNLGQDSAEKIGEYSDSMLKHVRTSDLDEMGKNLNQVIGVAKQVDITGLVGKGSMFGKLVSKFRNTKEAILSQFNSVSVQLDRVVKEIDSQRSRLQERANQLDTVFAHNLEHYKSLSLVLVYSEARKRLIQDKIALLSSATESQNSALVAQEISDLQTNAERIEKRIHDLKTLQMLALQTAPMIRMVQTNNITLIEKFDNIKMLTIPSWKKQFTLAISLLEQKKSVELANKIDDATNNLIKSNADLLRQNSLQTAQANQRSVVDIETLEHVQSTLITTLQDVVNIEREGANNRRSADEKMVHMKNELSNFLNNKRGNH